MSINTLTYSNTFADWVTTTNQLVNKANQIEFGDFGKTGGTLNVSVPTLYSSTLDLTGRTSFNTNVYYDSGVTTFGNSANVIFTVDTFFNTLCSSGSVKITDAYANGRFWFGNTSNLIFSNTNTIKVLSNNVIANLNADYLDGFSSNFFISYTNTSTIQAQSAFIQANTGTIQAQSAFFQANTGTIQAQSAFFQANTGTIQAQSAFFQANTGVTQAQAAFVQANTGTIQAQSAFFQANTGVTQAQAAFVQANTGTIQAQSAFFQANTGVTQAQAAFIQANNAYSVANTANSNALNASAMTSGTVAGGRGVTAGSSTSSFVVYNGTTKTAGQFDGGSTAPTNTTRLNFDGNLYATTFYGLGTGLTGTASGLTSANSTALITTNNYQVTNLTSTGRLLIADGSAASPSIAWSSDTSTDTGLYWGGQGYTFFTNNGTKSGEIQPGGNLVMVGDVSAYSDANIKEDIQTIQNALDTVIKMRGVNYTRKDTGKKGTGVIAQEMQQVVPEVVNDDTEMLSVAYGNLIGYLIEAVKELNDKISNLENK